MPPLSFLWELMLWITANPESSRITAASTYPATTLPCTSCKINIWDGLNAMSSRYDRHLTPRFVVMPTLNLQSRFSSTHRALRHARSSNKPSLRFCLGFGHKVFRWMIPRPHVHHSPSGYTPTLYCSQSSTGGRAVVSVVRSMATGASAAGLEAGGSTDDGATHPGGSIDDAAGRSTYDGATHPGGSTDDAATHFCTFA